MAREGCWARAIPFKTIGDEHVFGDGMLMDPVDGRWVNWKRKLGSHDKTVEVAHSMLTLAAGAIEATEDDEQARAFYEEQMEGRLPIEPAAFPQFRKLLENEMDIWFRARGLLLIGEPIEDVEAILKEEIATDVD